jgi:hypothetical protein
MNGIQKAHEYGSACPQVTLSPLPFISFNPNYTSISEDCKPLFNLLRLTIVDCIGLVSDRLNNQRPQTHQCERG